MKLLWIYDTAESMSLRMRKCVITFIKIKLRADNCERGSVVYGVGISGDVKFHDKVSGSDMDRVYRGIIIDQAASAFFP